MNTFQYICLSDAPWKKDFMEMWLEIQLLPITKDCPKVERKVKK